METLVTVVKRANGNLFDLENYVARELGDDHGQELRRTRNRRRLISHLRG